jgi:hypothetical protein
VILHEAGTTCKSEGEATTLIPGCRRLMRSIAAGKQGISLGQIPSSQLVTDTL